MEMLTQLQTEQHIAKELAARLGQQEDELKATREQVRAFVTCCIYVSLVREVQPSVSWMIGATFPVIMRCVCLMTEPMEGQMSWNVVG